ncbi:MAG: peptide deformylase [Candidatus Omnitrophica bacterium]|nr:peptide deformylase [Candidatus Omnitrophota bacterium]
MAILEIKKYPDKALRKRSRPVGAVSDADRRLVRDMFETMYAARGIGLAAPQVGVSKRVIVCNPTGQKKDELAIINPEFMYKKGRKVKECEGCLSIPTMTGEVSRFSVIGVSGTDINGNAIVGANGRSPLLEADGLLARIILHEADHLDGVLFIDRIGFLKRRALIRRYGKKMGISCVGRWY